jgi:aldehyde:ferredoxin oxidoreductase
LKRRIACLDLAKDKIAEKSILKEMCMLHLGGMETTSYLRYNLLESKVDPLSPENAPLMGLL